MVFLVLYSAYLSVSMKNSYLLLLCFCCLAGFTAFGQKKVYRSFHDADGFPLPNSDAAVYYKLYDSVEGTKFHVQQWKIDPGYMVYDGYVLVSATKPEVKDGYFKYYDKAGHKIKEGAYENDIRQGTWTYYYAGTDDMKCTIPYKGVKRPCAATYYYPNNEVKKRIDYLADSSIHTTCFDDSGRVIYCIDTGDIETMPAPAFDVMRFLSVNLNYPEDERDRGVQGTVLVQFMVREDGSITDAHVLQGIGGGCDREALRVIKLMPKWTPATVNGIETDVLFTQPITFRLEGNY